MILSKKKKCCTKDKLCEHVGYSITGKDLGGTSSYSFLFLTWLLGSWETFYEETQYQDVMSVWLPRQHFAQIFFRVCGACSANHFLTNIFIHTKLRQHGGGQNVFGCLRQWHKSKFLKKHSLQTQQLYWSHILSLKLFRKCPKHFQNTFFSQN